ncbi:MAG: hypothetical protein JEZ05_10905 [Tenericutes bacterium]|nr:hypothetical protein [Mycoplasmatota bacterium]
MKSMINNRGIIAAITGFLTICIMSVNIVVMAFGMETMEIVYHPNQENTIYVTESSFMNSWTREYSQKNILFMERVIQVEPITD